MEKAFACQEWSEATGESLGVLVGDGGAWLGLSILFISQFT